MTTGGPSDRGDGESRPERGAIVRSATRRPRPTRAIVAGMAAVAALGVGASAAASTTPGDTAAAGSGEVAAASTSSRRTTGPTWSVSPTPSSATPGATRWSPSCSTPPTRTPDIEDLLIANADNDVSTMNSQISDIVASGVDILLVNAVSSTASNAELERAHDAGVVVVSFDATVDTPVSIRVNTDPAEFGRDRCRVARRRDGRQRLGDRPQRHRRQPRQRGPVGRRPGGARRRRDRSRRSGERRLGSRRRAAPPPPTCSPPIPTSPASTPRAGRCRSAPCRRSKPPGATRCRCPARATTSSSRCGPS